MQHTSCCYEGSYAQYHGDAEDQDDYIASDFLRRHSRYRHWSTTECNSTQYSRQVHEPL